MEKPIFLQLRWKSQKLSEHSKKSFLFVSKKNIFCKAIILKHKKSNETNASLKEDV